MTTALIAEDEPLLAAEIREELARLWPELAICATVHDGHEALREIDRSSTAGRCSWTSRCLDSPGSRSRV